MALNGFVVVGLKVPHTPQFDGVVGRSGGQGPRVGTDFALQDIRVWVGFPGLHKGQAGRLLSQGPEEDKTSARRSSHDRRVSRYTDGLNGGQIYISSGEDRVRSFGGRGHGCGLCWGNSLCFAAYFAHSQIEDTYTPVAVPGNQFGLVGGRENGLK